MKSSTLLVLPITDLYDRLLKKLSEDIDLDEESESYMFSAGYTKHRLVEWWLQRALFDVLALPISSTSFLPLKEGWSEHVKHSLSSFETDILRYAQFIRRIDAHWVDCIVRIDPYRLTLEIV